MIVLKGDVAADVMINLTMVAEGGYADLRGDSGGKTLYGIASRYAPPDIKKKVENRTLTRSEAYDYYYKNYYSKKYVLSCKSPIVRFLVFDSYVHGMSKGTVLCLQGALNLIGKKVEIDGQMGSETGNALASIPESDGVKFLNAYNDNRIVGLSAGLIYRSQVDAASKKGVKVAWSIESMSERLRKRISSAYSFSKLYDKIVKGHKLEISDFQAEINSTKFTWDKNLIVKISKDAFAHKGKVSELYASVMGIRRATADPVLVADNRRDTERTLTQPPMIKSDTATHDILVRLVSLEKEVGSIIRKIKEKDRA